jgi:hypothetical protein
VQNYLQCIEKYNNRDNNSLTRLRELDRHLFFLRMRLITEILELMISCGFSLAAVSEIIILPNSIFYRFNVFGANFVEKLRVYCFDYDYKIILERISLEYNYFFLD